jgi:hypothetical protein
MPHTCTTCQHPDCEEIDGALAANVPLRKIGDRFGLSPSALWRHKCNHLGKRSGQQELASRVESLELRVAKLHTALERLVAALMEQRGV